MAPKIYIAKCFLISALSSIELCIYFIASAINIIVAKPWKAILRINIILPIKFFAESNASSSTSLIELFKKLFTASFPVDEALTLILSKPKIAKNNNIITVDTKPKPDNFYGDSKLQAENRLRLLSDDKFKIVILRPPMIYGEGCKGNYKNLSKIARYSPLFPKIENIRSMLYIENLCEFIRLLIENRESGLFFPQNSEYVKTSDLVKTIANIHKRKIIFTKAFNKIIKYCKKSDGKIGKLCSKAFGNLAYSKEVSDLNLNYNLIGFEESVVRTENPTNE